MKNIILLLFLISSLSYSKGFNPAWFASKIGTKGVVKLSKTYKAIKKSKFTQDMPKIKLNKAVSKNTLAATSVASKIAKKGNFENNLMTTAAQPLQVIQQYARYGEPYLKSMQVFGTRASSISLKTYKNIKQRFPTAPKINFKTPQAFNDAMVKTLQYTGKKGWKVSQKLFALAIKYPKSTVVSGLIAWYYTDPESFMEQKDNLIEQIGVIAKEGVSDITDISLNASSGIADGFMKSVKENLTISNVIVLIVLFFTFIIWKLRSYIKRIIKAKLENSVSSFEKRNNTTNNNSNSYENNNEPEGRL